MCPYTTRRVRIAVECTCLENKKAERSRGFESHTLLQIYNQSVIMGFTIRKRIRICIRMCRAWLFQAWSCIDTREYVWVYALVDNGNTLVLDRGLTEDAARKSICQTQDKITIYHPDSQLKVIITSKVKRYPLDIVQAMSKHMDRPIMRWHNYENSWARSLVGLKQMAHNRESVGSNPTGPTKNLKIAEAAPKHLWAANASMSQFLKHSRAPVT